MIEMRIIYNIFKTINLALSEELSEYINVILSEAKNLCNSWGLIIEMLR